MDKNSKATFSPDCETRTKRAYRKPVVQIYGTLKEITQFNPSASNTLDNAAPFPQSPPNNNAPLNRT